VPELCLAQVRLLPIQGLTVHFSRGLSARGVSQSALTQQVADQAIQMQRQVADLQKRADLKPGVSWQAPASWHRHVYAQRVPERARLGKQPACALLHITSLPLALRL
jgi:hypothetical protein